MHFNKIVIFISSSLLKIKILTNDLESSTQRNLSLRKFIWIQINWLMMLKKRSDQFVLKDWKVYRDIQILKKKEKMQINLIERKLLFGTFES